MEKLEKKHYSNNQLNKAGEILRTYANESPEYKDALTIVNDWRLQHAEPINIFRKILKRKTLITPKIIIAQRLKRMPTIIDKLSRHPEMNLSRMQDIGGLRVISPKIKDINTLAKKMHDKRFKHTLIHEKDYIIDPKLDGYRGIHLIFKCKNKDGNIHQVEIQIRTQLQHTWATAVETLGIIKGEAYKSDKGNKEWLEFFALISSIFAYIEKTPPLALHRSYSVRQLINKVSKMESELRFLQQLLGINAAVSFLHRNRLNTQGYNLLVLNPSEKKVSIHPFKKSETIAATKAYEKAEAEASKNNKTLPVLVTAGGITAVKAAYPNYFLDLNLFVNKVNSMLEVISE